MTPHHLTARSASRPARPGPRAQRSRPAPAPLPGAGSAAAEEGPEVSRAGDVSPCPQPCNGHGRRGGEGFGKGSEGWEALCEEGLLL